MYISTFFFQTVPTTYCSIGNVVSEQRLLRKVADFYKFSAPMSPPKIHH